MTATPTGRIRGHTVYRGRVVELAVDRVRFPDGSEGEIEVVHHAEAAAVLPLRPGGGAASGVAASGTGPVVTLLCQYRYPAGGEVWEAPAGLVDEGETPAECALRELREEAGIRAAEVRRLTTILTSPGFTDERIHLFLALGLEECGPEREPSEFFERRDLPLEDALRRVDSGEIADAKTICLLMYAGRQARL